MAMKKPSVVVTFSLVLMLLLLADYNTAENAEITHPEAPSSQPPSSNNSMKGTTEGSLQPQECKPRCDDRCSKTQYKKPCLFFCQKCCAKCLCVPPGTYGNKQRCPCYNNWKTKRGGPKCP